jgi:hypothetical protein
MDESLRAAVLRATPRPHETNWQTRALLVDGFHSLGGLRYCRQCEAVIAPCADCGVPAMICPACAAVTVEL